MQIVGENASRSQTQEWALGGISPCAHFAQAWVIGGISPLESRHSVLSLQEIAPAQMTLRTVASWPPTGTEWGANEINHTSRVEKQWLQRWARAGVRPALAEDRVSGVGWLSRRIERHDQATSDTCKLSPLPNHCHCLVPAVMAEIVAHTIQC